MAFTVTVLGCGTSTGVPVPACECSVCLSTDSKNKRLRTSCIITLDSGYNILIDAGIDLRQQVLAHNIKRIDAVLFTHAHSDHILGIDDLRCFNIKTNQAIPCFATATTLTEIRKTFRYLFEERCDYKGGMLAKLDLNEIQIEKSFIIFDQEITPFQLFHGDMEVIGYKIADFVYATDCNKIPDKSERFFQNGKIVFLDALRHRAHKTHFTVSEALHIADKFSISKTYLIHMTHDIEYHQETGNLPINVSFAFDGLQVRVP